MVLTVAQCTTFYTHADQMGVSAATYAQLQVEGITSVDDLADFDKDSLKQLAGNLQRPGGRVPDPTPGAAAGATIPTPAFVFGAKSHHRMMVSSNLVKYYLTTGRATSAANMQWNTVGKNFDIQWKALCDRKEENEPEVPKITKALPIIKWTEAFSDNMNRVIGVRTIPLAYIIRPEVQVPAAAPPLTQGEPHSNEHGSVEAELIARASHNHALYRDDNAAVYFKLEEATRGTQYAASIKTFQRAKNGRGAWLALTSQYAGVDKWEAEIKRQEQLLHTRIWKGQSSFALESFITQHRNAYVSMQACAEHIQYQLPNEHSRVGFLLEGIQCPDPGLQAAMASIKTDNGQGGLRNDFEAAVSHLLPYDPVAKKRSAGTKRGQATISFTEGEEAEVSSTIAKKSIGSTGVHLRYYKAEEYKKLSDEQKAELKEWRSNNPSETKKSKKDKSFKGKEGHMKFNKFNKQVASLVTKQIETQLKKMSEDESKTEVDEAAISSLIEEAVNKRITATIAQPATKKVTLTGILKNAKNSRE
jgi:hypothetical protein